MKLSKFSLNFIKDLYTLKINAAKRDDQQALAHLKSTYPELFQAEFLMDMLKNFFDNAESKDKNIQFKPNLTNIH